MTVGKAWQVEAACLGADPELFFPLGTTGPASAQIEQALALCRQCRVSAQCLKWALDTRQDVGVWGGLTEDERRALRRRKTSRR